MGLGLAVAHRNDKRFDSCCSCTLCAQFRIWHRKPIITKASPTHTHTHSKVHVCVTELYLQRKPHKRQQQQQQRDTLLLLLLQQITHAQKLLLPCLFSTSSSSSSTYNFTIYTWRMLSCCCAVLYVWNKCIYVKLYLYICMSVDPLYIGWFLCVCALAPQYA